MSYLATLESGWHDGDGEPFTPASINAARRLVRTIEADRYTALALTDGSISIEPRHQHDADLPAFTILPSGQVEGDWAEE